MVVGVGVVGMASKGSEAFKMSVVPGLSSSGSAHCRRGGAQLTPAAGAAESSSWIWGRCWGVFGGR